VQYWAIKGISKKKDNVFRDGLIGKHMNLSLGRTIRNGRIRNRSQNW
jgi:hypothetical protein